MPRAAVEVLARSAAKHVGIAHRKCASCSGVGEFASDTTLNEDAVRMTWFSMPTQRISQRPDMKLKCIHRNVMMAITTTTRAGTGRESPTTSWNAVGAGAP
jgi:hypothetical protein